MGWSPVLATMTINPGPHGGLDIEVSFPKPPRSRHPRMMLSRAVEGVHMTRGCRELAGQRGQVGELVRVGEHFGCAGRNR